MVASLTIPISLAQQVSVRAGEERSVAAPRLVRLVLVSEIQLYREGLAARVAGEPGWELIASLDSLPEALRVARESAADLVLFNVPPESGNLRALEEAVSSLPGTRFVALDVGDVDEAIAWVEVGVAGFLEQRDSFDELREVIESVMRDELRCSPRMAGALLQRVRELSRLRWSGSVGLLTLREREILRLVGQGLSNPEIADRMRLRLPTVKNHVHHVLQKLQVPTREAAANVAREARL
jgi:two-component system, NarL family, nitrate/nitrite response regulator NarL